MSDEKRNNVFDAGDILIIGALLLLIVGVLGQCEIRVRVTTETQANTPAR